MYIMNFKLDYNKWNHVGKTISEHGDVILLNDKGYSCCLGLCALQMGISASKILGNLDPEHLSDAYLQKSLQLSKFLKIFTVSDDSHNDKKINNTLADNAIIINDNVCISIKQRIDRLITLFKEHGHKLSFINVPEGIYIL